MNQEFLKSLESLKEAILKSEDYLKLKDLEKKMSEDETVIKLAYKKDMLSVKFDDALKHYGEDSEETSLIQKELFKAKLELDNNEIVSKYNEQFKKVKEMYNKINEEIFFPFN